MRLATSRSWRHARRTAFFAAVLAVVLAATGFEASAHGHLPAKDGWHDPSPHGASARDEGLKSCSICRLAHEASSAPVAPRDVSAPERVTAPPVPERMARPLAVLAPEHSPRAPPSAPTS